jgi:hypothetical protein
MMKRGCLGRKWAEKWGVESENRRKWGVCEFFCCWSFLKKIKKRSKRGRYFLNNVPILLIFPPKDAQSFILSHNTVFISVILFFFYSLTFSQSPKALQKFTKKLQKKSKKIKKNQKKKKKKKKIKKHRPVSHPRIIVRKVQDEGAIARTAAYRCVGGDSVDREDG